jgi:hypothetical protein
MFKLPWLNLYVRYLAKLCLTRQTHQLEQQLSGTHPDRYAVDLIVDTGSETFYCEVEIKKVWQGAVFKYDTLQIPERKSKFAKLDKPAYFMVFNDEKTHAFVCPSSILLSSPVVEVPNKYVYKGELFFQVPINLISLVEIPNGN